MSEELTKQLNSYKAQLQQVEVALSTDTENEDLQKLQKDLQVRANASDRRAAPPASAAAAASTRAREAAHVIADL